MAITRGFWRMVQRTTKFARKPSRHVEVGVLARTSLNRSDHLRAVPLDVLPLLAPFRKRGRLSVRIENLPIQARLSQGRNNGDHSYSLTLDELEDLSYLAPDGTDPHPVLSLRIVALDDGDAATIAVRDLPVDFGTERGEGIDDEDFRRLSDELAAVKSDLAVREAELAEARLKAAEKNVPARNLDAELEAAQERWQEESAAALARAQREWQQNEAARLAAAEAKWRAHTESAIETARASSKAVREHGDAIELRRLRDELMAMQTLLAERDAELAQSHAALAKPQGPTSADLDAAIAAARKDWQAAETMRFAAAEARWREQAGAIHDKGDAELRRLRDDLADANTRLSHRDKELAELQIRLRQMQDAAQRETERFAAAEQAWQEKSNAALAAARAAGVAARDSALAENRAHAAAALDAALANAQLEWKAQEAERLMAAERNWQEQSAKAVADARAQSQTSRAAADAEQAHLRGELGALKTLLAERDAALAEARAATEQARADARVRLASAEKSWRAPPAPRLSAAEKSLAEKSDAALTDEQAARLCAEAEARTLREHVAGLETTLADRELELTQAIARVSASQAEIESFHENEDISVRRVRGEVAALQASLAERDEELAQARLFAERSYERWQKQAEAERAKAQKAWKADEAARLAAARAQWQDEARKHLEDTLAAERRTVPATPHEGISAPPAAGIEHRPLPEFSPPLLSPSGPPRAAHLSSARDAADEALDRLAKDAYQLLASPPPQNTAHPTDTGIVKGNLTERRHNGALKNQGLAPTAAIAAALAAIVALAVLFLWPMLFGAQTPRPVAAPVPAAQVEPEVKQALPTAVVLRNVNVRSAPSTSAAILTTLKRGATVAVTERNGIWTRIESATEGQGAVLPGWIVTSAIEPAVQKSSAARPPAAAPKADPNVAAVSESPPPPASEAGQAAQTPAESESGAAGGP